MGVNQQRGYAQIVNTPSGGGSALDSEWWGPREAPDPRDEDFTGGPGLPTGYAWWTDSGIAAGTGALLAHAAVNNVTLSFDNAPAVVNYKIGAAATGGRRPSWMQCQVPAVGGGDDPRLSSGFYLLKPYSPAANGCTWTRVGYPQHWITAGTGTAGIMLYWVIMGQTAGVPDRNAMLMIGAQGQNSAGGNLNGNFYVVNGTAADPYPIGSGRFSQGTMAGLGFRRRASINWSGFFINSGSDNNRFIEEFDQNAFPGFGGFTPIYSGWKFVCRVGQNYNPVFGTDLARFSDDENSLPL